MEVLVCFRISKYKIIEEREKTQDDSGMDLPYNRVSINLLGDPDIQNALNKSASAEDLVSPRGPSLVGLVVVAHGSLYTHHMPHWDQSGSCMHHFWICMLHLFFHCLCAFSLSVGYWEDSINICGIHREGIRSFNQESCFASSEYEIQEWINHRISTMHLPVFTPIVLI